MKGAIMNMDSAEKIEAAGGVIFGIVTHVQYPWIPAAGGMALGIAGIISGYVLKHQKSSPGGQP